ncbi:MAG: hypothetical protein KatS3mg068_0139 [Candidatus Sericytochromatia bacterium]|nr:MAG: hypothetical protein KatS3mg068_0139 [Candidatus Sericytochromatia bacterium]
MIKKLFIENFILIDNLEINFDKGLTVLIGETGAGKSLIISSIESLLGGKTNYDCIGNYKDYSYIEGVFLLNDNAKRFLKENDFDEFDNEVIISKTIRKSSSKYRINGILVNNNLVKKLSENIIDIIGQHENQYLFKSEKHIHFLDSLGDEEHKILLEELKSLYNKIISLKKEHDFLCKEILENKRLLDFYKFQLNEIVEANLKLNEDLELKEEREILVNSQEIITILSKAYNNIYSSNEYSIIDSLSKLTKEIYSISKFSSDIEKICIELDNITDNLKEISRSIRFKLESIETNPNRLIEVEDRLNIINNLKKKYGNTIEEILNFSVDLKNKLLLIESSDEKIDNLYKEITNLENEYALLAKKLSKNRKNIAKKA